MRQKLYVMRSGEALKVGISINPKKRRDQLQCGNESLIEVILETDFCDNAEKIESVVHVSLSGNCVSGEWFDADEMYVTSVVRDCFSTLAINAGSDSGEDVASIGDFLEAISEVEIIDGMYKVSSMMGDINKYRVNHGLGEKQLAAFFITDMARQSIAESCIKRGVPVSMVKSSSRGRHGGTFIDKDVFSVFIKWASSCPTISIADLCPNVGTCISKAIQKCN